MANRVQHQRAAARVALGNLPARYREWIDLQQPRLAGLSQPRREMAEALLAETLSIKVSGCPNGCGQHYVAGIGFQGSVRKIAGRPVPQYHVFVGGRFDGSSFGRLAVKVPARRAPETLTRLLELYATEKQSGETPDDYFARVPLAHVQALLADLTEMSEAEATPDDFIDLGEKQSFEVVLQEGECAA